MSLLTAMKTIENQYSITLIFLQGKQDVRQVRKDGMDVTKKLKGSIGDDDIKRYTKDIDAIMDKKLEKITKIMKEKEAELLRQYSATMTVYMVKC